ncbi:MAG TPA: Arm DNA-binding domain-containing protein [Dysgonamonadaceae bacterium]|nr:Arm DNA-binding domain-containing protein [Dysgonamonadaceae bacterium]
MTSNNQKLNDMKAQNTFGIRFFVRKNKMKDDKLPIYVSVTVNGRRSEISLKHFIAKNHWNAQAR